MQRLYQGGAPFGAPPFCFYAVLCGTGQLKLNKPGKTEFRGDLVE
jgi:hypothetical protein